MHRYSTEVSKLRRNIHRFQITVDTLNDVVDRATTRSVGPPENLHLLPPNFVLKNLISHNYMEERYLSVDTKKMALDELDAPLEEFVDTVTELEKCCKSLEDYYSKAINSSVPGMLWILEYIVSALKKDVTLKMSLATSLKRSSDLEELQRIRFLWLDSPVSEYKSEDDNLFAGRLSMLKSLIQFR